MVGDGSLRCLCVWRGLGGNRGAVNVAVGCLLVAEGSAMTDRRAALDEVHQSMHEEYHGTIRREDIIRLAREAGASSLHGGEVALFGGDAIERFAALVAAAERDACAKLCEEKQTYSMPIPCPDGIEGCCVAHVVPARREKTGSECAAAIRARNT